MKRDETAHKRVSQKRCNATRRLYEIILITKPGVLIGGIARGAGLQHAVVRQEPAGHHQPFLGSYALALDPCLYPTLDHLDVDWTFLAVSHRQVHPRLGI